MGTPFTKQCTTTDTITSSATFHTINLEPFKLVYHFFFWMSKMRQSKRPSWHLFTLYVCASTEACQTSVVGRNATRPGPKDVPVARCWNCSTVLVFQIKESQSHWGLWPVTFATLGCILLLYRASKETLEDAQTELQDTRRAGRRTYL